MIRKFCEWLGGKLESFGRLRIIYGPKGEHYMKRYFPLFMASKSDEDLSTPSKRFNVMLHNIRYSDEPTYHDHPWSYMTIILSGGYWEHTPIYANNGVIIGDKKKWYGPGSIRFAKAKHMHWLEVPGSPVPGTLERDNLQGGTWTLFSKGTKVQEWGFQKLYSNRKVHWKEYLDERKRLGFGR